MEYYSALGDFHLVSRAAGPTSHLGNRRQVAIWNAQRELRSVLDRWETAYRKENFYRGIRILLELQREGSSTL